MPEKIIIAEDSAFIRKSLEQLISRRYDVEIEAVPDGKPFVERVRDSRYSAGLTDNEMLEMSGLTVLFDNM